VEVILSNVYYELEIVTTAVLRGILASWSLLLVAASLVADSFA
jgi:hypothetical protein